MQIDIKGFENYQITDDGRVWSKKSGKYLSLKKKDGGGYPQVYLYNEGKGKAFLVHRLVAEAFIPNPEKKPCVDHINTNKTDNRIENLRWCTHEENNLNPITYKKYGVWGKGKHPSDETRRKMSEAMKGRIFSEETRKKITESNKGKPKHEGAGTPPKPVIQYTLCGEFVAKYVSSCEASRQTGVAQSSISMACSGKRNRKSAGGFKWRYIST